MDGRSPEVDVDDRRRVDVGQDGVDAADVDLERGAELAQDPDVDVAGRPDRPDQRHVLALEDGGVAGDASLDGLLEDDVRFVQAGLVRSGGGVVVDLDGQGRSLWHRPLGRGAPVSGQFGGGAVVVVVVGFFGGAASLCAGEEHALRIRPARPIAPRAPQANGRRARGRNWSDVVMSAG